MKASLTKNILKWTALTAGLIIVAVFGWAFYFVAQFNVYTDSQYKFSIRYPKAWSIIVHPKATVAVIFRRPKDTALDTMQENFNVTVQPLPRGIFTLDEFSNRVRAQMISVFGASVHFVEYRPLHWGWREGYRMSIEAPTPDNLKMINVWVLNRDQAYILTFLGNIDKYPQDKLVVDEMIRSLKLK